MPAMLVNRKICYIEMPTTDIARSAEFYKPVFGWNIGKRGEGSTPFDDTVGEVRGTWVAGRPPAAKPGLLFYVMVDSVAANLDSPELTARFRDPAGNVSGLFQQS